MKNGGDQEACRVIAMSIWSWLRLRIKRSSGATWNMPSPHFEPLEPRELLDANVAGIESVLPPNLGDAERAIVVDWEREGTPVDPGVVPILAGLERVDQDAAGLQGQVVYLDFDGRSDFTYNGPVTVGPLEIPGFVAPGLLHGLEETAIADVLDNLRQIFAGSEIFFTTDQPVGGSAYSTIYVGGDDRAFADYGSFLGLAEVVDVGNQDPNDEAVVFAENVGYPTMDLTLYASELAYVIAHEAGHLLGYAHADPDNLMTSASEGVSSLVNLLASVAHFAGPDDGESPADAGPVHQWLTYNAYLFYNSQFPGSELAGFIGDWTDYGSKHHRTNGDDDDVIEGAFDEDVSAPTTYLFDDGFHWDIVPQNPLGQDIPYYRHFAAGGDGDEIYDGWSSYASAVTQAGDYWEDYVLDSYPTSQALSYYYLGHVAHLLEDMTVPAHVHNDAHPIRDAYEYTMGEHSNYLLWGYDNGVRTGPTGDIEMPLDLVSLFRETIDYTEEYDSDDGAGDEEPGIENIGRHRPDLVSTSGGFTGDGADLSLSSYNEMTVLADDLMPWAMEQVAALFRLFYSYVDTTGPTVDLTTTFGATEETAVLKPSRFHIAARACDDISGYDADGFHFTIERKNGGSWEPFAADSNTGQIEFNTDTDGLYRVWVEVDDAAGNTGASETGYFHVDQARTLAEVYRFWSPVSSRHFYTIDLAERDKLINNYADVWTYEGVAYYAFATEADPNVTPVYRFWSPSLGSHFYTTSRAERDKLTDLYSPDIWTYEGVAFYAYTEGTQPTGTWAAYRFWSPRLKTHFFTMSQHERDKLLDFYPDVWTYEGICWYAYMA